MAEVEVEATKITTALVTVNATVMAHPMVSRNLHTLIFRITLIDNLSDFFIRFSRRKQLASGNVPLLIVL